jgi:hypothetical protein
MGRYDETQILASSGVQAGEYIPASARSKLEQMKAGQAGEYIPPSDRSKLEQKKAALEGELVRVTKALDVLNAHPDLEEFTRVLQAGLR